MIRFRIVYDVKNTKTAVLQLKNEVIQPLENKVISLGFKTRDVMRGYIQSRRSNSSGNLASAIDTEIEKTDNFLSVGIGNISVLNARAKYWYVLNYGRRFDTGQPYVPPIPPAGSFGGGLAIPTQGYDSGKWTTGVANTLGGSRNYTFKPKQAIRAMNFIESTLSWLTSQLSTF